MASLLDPRTATQSVQPPSRPASSAYPSTNVVNDSGADAHSCPLPTEDDEFTPRLPRCNRSDYSDSNPESPWARKIILSLDGGGVRGYSSLLILKRVLFLIEQIERGQRMGYDLRQSDKIDDEPNLVRYKPNRSSAEYPWFTPPAQGDVPVVVAQDDLPQIEDEDDDDAIAASVDETFQAGTLVTQFKAHHYIDYIAGTSTGGLSAIMLARMEMDIEKAIGQYDDVGKKVFAKPRLLHSIKGGNALVPKYPTSNVENALRDVIKVGLQAELRLRDTTADKVPFESNPARSRTITVAHGPTTENNTVFRTYLFRSYDHPYPSPLSTLSYNEKHRNPGRAHQEPIWKIARATSAVPLYFRPISFGDHEYRDGGIGNKNPSSLALKEVLQMHEQRPRLLISIGTGTVEPPEPKAKGKVSTSIISHIKDSLQTIRLLTEWATESEKTHNEVEEYIDVMDQDKVQYYRFNTDMGKNKILLDEWKLKKDGSNETKDSLLNLTLAYLKQSDIHESLLRCARILAMVRRQRARTDRWELFAREFVYYCPEDRCKKVARTFETREDLRQHSYDAHGFVWEVDICNDTGLKHACFWDQCQHGSIHVYRTRDEYLKHLKDNHNIVQGPRFKTRSELEEWLDMGRKGPREAVEFIKNHRQKTMTTKSPPPKKGKNMASGVSLNSQLNGSSSP